MGNSDSHLISSVHADDEQRYLELLRRSREALSCLDVPSKRSRMRAARKRVSAYFEQVDEEDVGDVDNLDELRVVSDVSVAVDFPNTCLSNLRDEELDYVATCVVCCEWVEEQVAEQRAARAEGRDLKLETGQWRFTNASSCFKAPYVEQLLVLGTLIGVRAMTAFWRMMAEWGCLRTVLEDRLASFLVFDSLVRGRDTHYASAIGFARAGLVPGPVTFDDLLEIGLEPGDTVHTVSPEVRGGIKAIEMYHPCTMACSNMHGDGLTLMLNTLLRQGQTPDRWEQVYAEKRQGAQFSDMSPLAMCIQRYQVPAALTLISYNASVKDANIYLSGLMKHVVDMTARSRNGDLLIELCAAGLYDYVHANQADLVDFHPPYIVHHHSSREEEEATAMAAVTNAIERGRVQFERRTTGTVRAVESVMPRVLAEIVTSYAYLYVPPEDLE